MGKVKYAVVGCGCVSWNRYFPNLGSLSRGRLTAVCDTVEERAKRPGEQFKVPWYTDFDAMLAGADFDLLVNLSNQQAHFALSLKALQAGKHVYTQKPMTETVAQATALIDEAARRKLKLVPEEAKPILPVYRTMRKLLEEGAIGKVFWARATLPHWGPACIDNWPTDPSWFYQRGAGPLRDVGIEELHVLTSLLGRARRVTAMSGLNQPEVVVRGGLNAGKRVTVEEDDVTLVTLDFGDATFGLLDVAWVNVSATQTPMLEIYGHKGVISHMSGGEQKGARSDLSGGEEKPRDDIDLRLYRDEPELGIRGWTRVNLIPPLVPDAHSAVAGLAHAIDCIADDKKPVLTGEQARHCIEIIEKAYIAARTGVTQQLETTF